MTNFTLLRRFKYILLNGSISIGRGGHIRRPLRQRATSALPHGREIDTTLFGQPLDQLAFYQAATAPVRGAKGELPQGRQSFGVLAQVDEGVHEQRLEVGVPDRRPFRLSCIMELIIMIPV